MQKIPEKPIVLTPNKRLSRHLQKQYCDNKIAQNETSWHSLEILPLNTWLINYWCLHCDERLLLSKMQERILWQSIIDDNIKGANFSLTELALDYHELVNSWQIDEDILYSYDNEEVTTFRHLYKIFKNYCKNKKLITTSELPTIIISKLSCELSEITFVGFDEYTPQLQSLINAIERTGCRILKIDSNNFQNTEQKLLSFDSLKEEIVTATSWAKHLINNNHKIKIGIVVPNLVELRSKVSQIFVEVLDNTDSLNISAGIPFDSIPIIKCAIELLSLDEPYDLKIIGHILESPYIAGKKTEMRERILFNSELKLLGYSTITLKSIIHLAEKYKKNISSIIKIIQKREDFFLPLKNKTFKLREWSQIFTDSLKILGWPGENNLSDIELKAVENFAKLLPGFTTVDQILDKTSYKKALRILREFISHTMLQPETEVNVPINIFGTLEATGINFDYLWIMGVDEEHWPTAPKPNPFIPITIQKKLSLPHSSAERELQFCRTLIARYKRSAPKVIFSYTKQVEDRIRGPSYLVSDLPEISPGELNPSPIISWPEKIYHCRSLDTLSDHAPKLKAEETIDATSRLIESQSLCPFRTFMEFRLKISPAPKPGLGISKSDRGTLVHKALEQFWQEVKTQQNLCSLTAIELEQLINKHLEKSLATIIIPDTLYQLEKQHLVSLLSRWLEKEKTRAPFVVLATEKSLTLELATMEIRLRIDRIDQTIDGKKILIDYKTGKHLPSPNGWFKPLPENIQLPLYALAIDSELSLAWAQLNAKVMKFREVNQEELFFGLSTIDANSTSFKPTTWQLLLKYWRAVLTELAREFVEGVATVTPRTPQVCTQCPFDSACRIVHN